MLNSECGHYPLARLFGLAVIIGKISLIAWLVTHFFKISFDEAFKGIVVGIILLIILAVIVWRITECVKGLIKKVRGRVDSISLKFFLLCFLMLATNEAQASDAFLASVRANDLARVNLLISQGADVNAQYSFARTALHEAVMRGNAEIVRTLLSHGARVNQQSHTCETPLSLAKEHKEETIAALLRKEGAAKEKAEPSYHEVEAEGVAVRNDRQGAINDALDRVAEYGFTLLFNAPNVDEDWDRVFKKLRKHRDSIILSRVVLSESIEKDLQRIKIRATLDLCRIYELIKRMGSNLDKE